MGSAALSMAYVAAGRFDAYREAGLSPWDKAAGFLIIREAGGYVSEIDGGKNVVYGNGILTANPTLHGDLVKKMQTETKQEPAQAKRAP
jgi:myo-inositol-1(or 4)-monophosphatase